MLGLDAFKKDWEIFILLLHQHVCNFVGLNTQNHPKVSFVFNSNMLTLTVSSMFCQF